MGLTLSSPGKPPSIMPSPRSEISDVAVSPDHYIGGKRVGSDSTFEVRSPLDWEWKLADVARGDALTADRAVTAAVDAFPRNSVAGCRRLRVSIQWRDRAGISPASLFSPFTGHPKHKKNRIRDPNLHPNTRPAVQSTGSEARSRKPEARRWSRPILTSFIQLSSRCLARDSGFWLLASGFCFPCAFVSLGID